MAGYLTKAHAAQPQTPYASPADGSQNVAPILLPLRTILSPQDQDLYRQIFALQEKGAIKQARNLSTQLTNPLLMGHVLEQRYMHPTAYRSRFDELRDWLVMYADHPDAKRIYKLALRRKGTANNPPAPQKPVLSEALRQKYSDKKFGNTPPALPPKIRVSYGQAQAKKVKALQRTIRAMVQQGYVTRALEKLQLASQAQLIKPISYDQSLAVIIRGYFRYHKDKKAMTLALQNRQASPDKVPMVAWWGGLAAWREGAYEKAVRLFLTVADSPHIDMSYRTAGAFWGARAMLRAKKPAGVSARLHKAAADPYSFYGVLAARALGLTGQFDWEIPFANAAAAQDLRSIAAIERGAALLAVGQQKRAMAEFAAIWPRLPLRLMESMMLYLESVGLADLAYRIARTLEKRGGKVPDRVRYPLPNWIPKGGFALDRALIYAFVRQESRFNTQARSRKGAQGLMQLMPSTAEYVARKIPITGKRDSLVEPALNLSLGQAYIQYLLARPEISGNLFFTLVAYNAGPGNLAKWKKTIHFGDDPLLFIESLPSRETRHFVEVVLANLWLYRLRLGQKTPGMDQLLEGRWPIYIGLDQHLKKG